MIVIGQYREHYGDDYRPIRELVSDAPIENKNKILEYLKRQPFVAVAPVVLSDVISGERIYQDLTTQTDGVFAWRSDLAYYVEKYNMKLPDEFIKHVLKH